MTDISRHPIHGKIRTATFLVEALGASPEITTASTHVYELHKHADDLLDQLQQSDSVGDMFADVVDMNEAFGNPKGNPHAINGKKLFKQCMNIGHEYAELMHAFGHQCLIEIRPFTAEEVAEMKPEKRPPQGDAQIVAIRDALCDINVFSLGAHHFTGYDARVDMRAVYESNMSKFVKDQDDFSKTCDKFDKAGVKYTWEGEFPRMIFRSAFDQPDMPAGKFLKSASMFKPVFAIAPTPVPTAKEVISQFDAIVEMQREHAARRAEVKSKLEQLNKEVTAFRAKREQELFGLPPFDSDKNQMPGEVDEAKLRAIHEDHSNREEN